MASSNPQQNLTPVDNEAFHLRHTNVSNPSIVRNRPSQHSITASEDYYSLSNSSSSARSQDTVVRSGSADNAIHRYTTPPSRYRTPAQSQQHLPAQSRDNLGTLLGTQYDVPGDDEVRKTPMHGQGKRRSTGSSEEAAGPSAPAVAVLREGGIRRKPVPSTVMENPDSPRSQDYIDQSNARSSVARDLDRDRSPPTPGQDDTPYIRFALDQLTRDEDVRGSRTYPGQTAPGVAGPSSVPYVIRPSTTNDRDVAVPVFQEPVKEHADAIEPAGPSAYPAVAHTYREEAYPSPSHPPDQPFRAAKRTNLPQRIPDQRPDPFVFVPNDGGLHAPLNFIPAILRPLAMSLFILLVMTVTGLLVASAILSYARKGLGNYGSLGDSMYFVFEYLPTLLGVILYFWVVQIQVALFRIAPFIALASDSPHAREEGARLSIYPKTFLLPYLGHFQAKQAVVGIFMCVAWLQIWTMPLLASCYNVYFYTSINQWRWIATTGVIWAVIGLYLFLIIAAIVLMIWIRMQESGLRWDPRSLADMIVLLERSNALSMSEEEELRHDPPRLGYWRTQRSSNNEIFHTYGVAGRPARQYILGEDGRIREKALFPPTESRSRYSDPEPEMAREQRHSRDQMLPRHTGTDELEAGTSVGGRALPWFLRPNAALLWAVTAFVLVLAFLIVSYLPSTTVIRGFAPTVPSAIGRLGFSSTNFLYSFIPALLATICFLGWLDIDYAHRRLQPLVALVPKDGGDDEKNAVEGALAEKSLLLSYPALPPFLATAAALANAHLRVATYSLITIIAATLPILGGGVFFALWYPSTLSVRVAADMTAYYALTVFVVLYGAGCVALAVPAKGLKTVDKFLPEGNMGTRFRDVVGLVRRSRILDDTAFRGPASKTALVTRLLSAEPGYGRQPQHRRAPSVDEEKASGETSGLLAPPGQQRNDGLGRNQGASASHVSLADSVRGFGRAREQAEGFGGVGVPRYALGRFEGRDGREGVGLDRVRR